MTHYNHWEQTYFKHLLDMYKIFTNYAEHLIDINGESALQFHQFCKMIFNCSTHYISPHIEPLTPLYETLYFKYLVRLQNEQTI